MGWGRRQPNRRGGEGGRRRGRGKGENAAEVRTGRGEGRGGLVTWSATWSAWAWACACACVTWSATWSAVSGASPVSMMVLCFDSRSERMTDAESLRTCGRAGREVWRAGGATQAHGASKGEEGTRDGRGERAGGVEQAHGASKGEEATEAEVGLDPTARALGEGRRLNRRRLLAAAALVRERQHAQALPRRD